MKKLLIITAPSGAGKTTVVHHLLRTFPDQLAFSISATTRSPRPNEVHGRDYYFISNEEFQRRVAAHEFVEWEEVYPGKFYGTLRSEIERLWALNKTVLFDIEVIGATNLKNCYPDESLAVFIAPPSEQVLLERLQARLTETPESLAIRINRARHELTYQNNFDFKLVNDKLRDTLKTAENIAQQFLTPAG